MTWQGGASGRRGCYCVQRQLVKHGIQHSSSFLSHVCDVHGRLRPRKTPSDIPHPIQKTPCDTFTLERDVYLQRERKILGRRNVLMFENGLVRYLGILVCKYDVYVRPLSMGQRWQARCDYFLVLRSVLVCRCFCFCLR